MRENAKDISNKKRLARRRERTGEAGPSVEAAPGVWTIRYPGNERGGVSHEGATKDIVSREGKKQGTRMGEDRGSKLDKLASITGAHQYGITGGRGE